jgi:hypothetical protein
MKINTLYVSLSIIRLKYQFLDNEILLFNNIVDCLKYDIKVMYKTSYFDVKKVYKKFIDISTNKEYYIKKYNIHFIIDNIDDILLFIKSFEYRLPNVFSIENEIEIIEIKKRIDYIIRNEKINKLLK